jgi:hypothetical protein
VDRYQPASVIIVEGLQTIDDKTVGQTPDLRTHVETDFGQRMGRRFARDERVGFRNIKSSLEVIASTAVNHPELIQKFEASPDTSHCDFIVKNDYEEPDQPEVVIRGDEFVFEIGGKVKESRKLSPEERQAVIDLGFMEG